LITEIAVQPIGPVFNGKAIWVSFRRAKHIWEDNINTDLEERGRCGVRYKAYCRGAFAFAISRKLAVKAMHLLQVSQWSLDSG